MPKGATGAIPAILFLPTAGSTRAEHWLASARVAAAADLLDRLASAGYDPLAALAAEPSDREILARQGVRLLPEGKPPFHFGRTLARIVDEQGFTGLAYFGGASAPLADEPSLAGWLGQARELPPDGALVNNLHSTDWVIVRDARRLIPLADRLPTDNALGWVLREEGSAVTEVPPTTGSRTDFDTPGDLALIRNHPALGAHLRQALDPFPEGLGRKTERLRDILLTPAASVALIGRVSDVAWRAMASRAQIWARVYAEERGMRASGRQQRGEVRSLIADLVDESGPAVFVERLRSMVQAAAWDTRVWMARRGDWPSAGDRMASDLGWSEDVEDVGLRRLTQAVEAGDIPILTGGHGVVSGSLVAFLETLFPDHQEARPPKAPPR